MEIGMTIKPTLATDNVTVVFEPKEITMSAICNIEVSVFKKLIFF